MVKSVYDALQIVLDDRILVRQKTEKGAEDNMSDAMVSRPISEQTRSTGNGNSVLPTNLELRPVEDAYALPWSAIAGQLAKHGLNLDHEITPRQFAGGLANLNFLLRVNESWMVLRRPPPGPLPPGANDMRREHTILSRLWQALPLAPRSHYLCEDPAIAGAPFQLVEFRSGLAIRGNETKPLPATAETGRTLSQMMISTLAAIHAVDPAEVELGDLGRPEGFFRRTVSGWTRRAGLACDGSLPAAALEIIGWLERAPDPRPGRPVLLHNDFKLDNILIDQQSLAPRAIVDWDMGTRGDALFDLATLLSYWTESADPPVMHRLAQMPTNHFGFATREEAASAYAAGTGRNLGDIKAYRALTMLKLGVVFHQLHRLREIGSAESERYADFDKLGDELFEFTLDIIRERIF